MRWLLRPLKPVIRPRYQLLSGLIVENLSNPIEYNGVTIDVNCGAIQTKNKARFFPYYVVNEHSWREKTLVDRHLPREYPVVELGGGIGYISSYIDSHLEDVTQVVVEPNPDNIHCNKTTRRLNDAEYVLLEGAYDPDSEETTLSLDSKFSSGSTTKRMSDNSVKVSGYSLATIASEYDLEVFSLVCDIEGGEFEVLDAELDLLAEKVALAIIEFHPFDDNRESAYVEKIVDVGFKKLDEVGGTYAFRNTSFASQ